MPSFMKRYHVLLAYFFLVFSWVLIFVGFLFSILLAFDIFVGAYSYPGWAIIFVFLYISISFGVNRLSVFFIKELKPGRTGHDPH